MAKHNASHCFVHLCETYDFKGAEVILANVALENEVMAKAFITGAQKDNTIVLNFC